MSQDKPRSFTGIRRNRKTHWSVRVADKVARTLIAVGGIGTIAAVLTVSLFLFWVAVPLFFPASIDGEKKSGSTPGAPLHAATDEYRTMTWALMPGGRLLVLTLDENGTVLEDRPLFPEGSAKLTASGFSIDGRRAIFGFEDGTLRLAETSFTTSYLSTDDEVKPFEKLAAGASQADGKALVSRMADGRLRRQTFEVKLQDPIPASSPSPVRLVDLVARSSGDLFAVYHEDGHLMVNSVRARKNLMTGKTAFTVTKGELPSEQHEGAAPATLSLLGLGESLALVWPDGWMVRYDTRDLAKPTVAERLDLLPAPGVQITEKKLLVGRSTMLVGDSAGGLGAWFMTKPVGATTSDGAVFARAHELAPEGGSPVTSLEVSARSRLVAVGYADGNVRIFNVTSHKRVASVSVGSVAVGQIALSPRDDGFAVFGADGSGRAWEMNPRHPEATLAALFLPVWYEGASKPEQVWQSSAGSDDFEPKFGFWPLIFGTLKATVYSMVFAVPLAILAAIYTSEFLPARYRGRVKPGIELMASLPSVVLGFLAGLVIAPFVENWVSVALALFVTIPFAFLLGAYAWQLLPQRLTLQWAGARLLAILAVLPLGIAAAYPVGMLGEKILFAGNLRMWLDGQAGGALGGWVFLLLPPSVVAVLIGASRFVDGWMRRSTAGWSRQKLALFDLGKFLAAVAASFALAAAVGGVLALLGLDPRGSVTGTYIQRNALVVGFVMGFAVIPIIYTIADDALSTVPMHLRSASLGAGATPWQTATRIVIPTAMSGLFSAVMVGLGRAVGETMIVLMAAGNTPIMDWNIFNGFRTLSANIAVELPEAVRNSTHYRTLFLAALTLFLMTFLINTLAEAIRIRFRKRAVEL